MSEYIELHCHSAFSLREGASSPLELVLRARDLGYAALALTDHDGLYGAMEFAQAARAWGVRPITGAELTLTDGSHLTLLAENRAGYGNLCRLITAARMADREEPRLDPALLPVHAAGLVALSGCRESRASLCAADENRTGTAAALRDLRAWFGHDNVFVELQRNLVYGDSWRNAALVEAARSLGLPVVATNSVHYHVRERHRLHDVLVAIRHRTTLDGSHRQRRPNSEFYLKSPAEMAALFRDLPEAIRSTRMVAERCAFNLATDLDYAFPDYPTPNGEPTDVFLAALCREELAKRFNPLGGEMRAKAEARLAEELRLIAKHGLAGFFLQYRDLLIQAREVANDVYNRNPDRPRDWQPAGRGRGSSVGSIVCYLIGLSHIDPIKTKLFLGRFLNEDLSSVPDIDLDFPRKVREELLRRILEQGSVGTSPPLPSLTAPSPTAVPVVRPSTGRGLPGGALVDESQNSTVTGEADPPVSPPRSRGDRMPRTGQLLPAPNRGERAPAGSSLSLSGHSMSPLSASEPVPMQSGRGPGGEVSSYNTRAALVCTFPTYQIRSAVRDVGKALGLPETELDKIAKQSAWAPAAALAEEMARMPEFRGRVRAPLWRDLIALAKEIDGLPRHVSQHVGGVVLSARPLHELAPMEPAAMEGRYLCGWDKDSVDDARFIKIDFLALGMLSLVDECLELILEHRGQFPDLGRIPHDDPHVFDMICRGDTLGIFQIESRAQIQTLPRTRPRTIDDLIVEVAIIRPGPITGGAVNPYILRRQGREPVRYDHDLLEPVLAETLGVILFQEQVLQVAMAIAGFTAGQAESLRRAMSRKRSHEAMAELWDPFRTGAAARGVDEATARTVFEKLLGFAAFGFPKSHSAAFALLAYESAWLKLHCPAPFYCALFNNQPMGFYSPAVLTGDARRHGVPVLRPDVNRSGAMCTVEVVEAGAGSGQRAAGSGAGGSLGDGPRDQGERVHRSHPDADRGGPYHPDTGEAVRLGFAYVDGISAETARAIEAERVQGGPFASLPDFVRRTNLRREPVEHLIAAGAFDGFGMGRRESLWLLGLLGRASAGAGKKGRGAGSARSVVPAPSFIAPAGGDMVRLREPGAWEQMTADYAILGLSPEHHPMALLRRHLGEGYATSTMLERLRDGTAVTVAGLVVCRQRPMTARGFVFLSLEDEFGLANAIIRPPLYERRRTLIRTEPFLIVSGLLQLKDGTTNVLAREVQALRVPPNLIAPRSKDWG